MLNPDSIAYLSMADYGLFADPVRPAGYSMLLIAIHALSETVAVTVWIQHLLGIATGLLLYGLVRRAGAPVWVATIAAASILLSLDQIGHEHGLLSEAPFVFCVTASLYAAVRTLDEPSRVVGMLTTRTAWLVAAALLVGLSVWIRAVGVALIPLFAVWFTFALPGAGWTRVGRGALAGLAGLATVVVYLGLNSSSTGYFGLTEGSGWAIYSRTAPFADCDDFEPPRARRGFASRLRRTSGRVPTDTVG